MALTYSKPGVEVTQVQTSTSPTLLAQDLKTVVVGKGCYVVDVDDYTYSTVYDNTSTAVTLQTPDTTLVSGAVDANSIYVDLIQKTGAAAGTTVHLYDSSSHWSYLDGVVTIASGLSTTYSGINNATIKIGYRINRTDLDKFMTFESITDIENKIGDVDLLNPLGYAVYVALANSNAVVHGYGTDTDDTTGHTSALTALSTREVYTLVPVSQVGAVIDLYSTHVDSYSAPAEKKERIVVGNRNIAWADANDTAVSGPYDSSFDAAGTSRLLRANALAKQAKRTIWTFPDIAYVLVTAHVTTLRQAYINTNICPKAETYRLYAKLATDRTFSDGTRAYAYDDITDSVWTKLANDTVTTVSAWVPVPGYYLAAAVGGQISGESPEQGLTNLPIAGISFLRFSSDFFTESQLNTIAEGGNYILNQGSDTSPISCRHQLTTDMTTIEAREVNIVKSVDFVAKFLRNALTPYIGRYNVTPAFLKLATSICNGAGLYLIREGVIKDFKLTSIAQDTVNPDTINVEFKILVKYPVNYIKVDLVF